jgi:hypothetical protein
MSLVMQFSRWRTPKSPAKVFKKHSIESYIIVLRSLSFFSSYTYIYSTLKPVRVQSIHAIEGRENINKLKQVEKIYHYFNGDNKARQTGKAYFLHFRLLKETPRLLHID